VLNWPSQVQSITALELAPILASPRIVGIHCWADWNGYDYEFADRLRLTAAKFGTLIDLYAINTEHGSNVDVLATWGVCNIPAFVIFRDGIRLTTICMERESVAEFQQRVDDRLCALTLVSGPDSNGRSIAPN
jgi:hypothetical protein